MRKRKTILVEACIALIFLSVIAGIAIKPTRAEKQEPFFTIYIRNWEKDDFDNYAGFFKNQLERINIETKQSKYWSINYLFSLMAYQEFDTAYVKLHLKDNLFLDITHPSSRSNWYAENGSYNLAGYTRTMDYNQSLGTGTNEWYLQAGREILPAYSQERINHYQAWEEYLLTEIVPCVPLFRKKLVDSYWNNLVNFKSVNKLLSSWGKMYWNNSHKGQVSTNEIIVGDNAWSDLNPLTTNYLQYSIGSSKFIYQKIFDPLVWFDSSGVVYPHLAKSWIYLNNTHLRIKLREGIKWQTDPEGLFSEEDFTAEDVYFSLKCYDYPLIEKLEIINQTCIDIFFDGDPKTTQNEPYADNLVYLSSLIVPEHYLNQTQLGDGITPDKSHSSWGTFGVQPFGTGLFHFNSFTEGIETILEVNPNSWWLNNTITNDSMLNWTQRFGTFSSGLNRLRIKILANGFSALDSKKALSYLNAGIIDLVQGTDMFDVQLFTDNERIATQESSEQETSYLFFNLRQSRPTVFNDRTPCKSDATITKGLAVRKAIYYALNRTEMTGFYRSNGLIVHNSLFIQDSIWSNPNLIQQSANIQKAKEYLELAGYTFETTTLSQSLASVVILTSSLIVTTIVIIIKKRD